MKDKVLVEFAHPMGHRVLVETTSDRIWETLFAYGRKRWVPTMMPPGGLHLPLDNHDDFPWEVIGATQPKTYKNANGDEQTVVYWRGERYVQRRGEAGGRRKMPEAIWYSRGLRDTDPPVHNPEAEYLRLITFSGPGKFQFPALGHREDPASLTLEERYRRARERLSAYAEGLSESGKAALRETMRAEGLTAPPQPLTEAFVARYEAFVGGLGAK